MNSRVLLSAINEIEDRYIEEAAPQTGKSKWKIWISIAACFCIAAVVIIFVADMRDKGSSAHTDYYMPEIRMIEYNNAYFEFVESAEIRERNGLPEMITADMAGEHIAYLQGDGIYTPSVSKTDMELYTYAPKPCDAVMIVREGNEYSIALFCNYISGDGNIKMEMSEYFRIFNVDSAEDIASVTKTTWDKKKNGKKVTDSAAISEFFNEAAVLECYDNDSFQMEVFGGRSEEEQQKISIALAEDAQYLCIETVDGLKFSLTVYLNHGWMYTALSYYKMSEDMLQWYSENISGIQP